MIAEKAKVQRRSTGEPHLTPEEQAAAPESHAGRVPRLGRGAGRRSGPRRRRGGGGHGREAPPAMATGRSRPRMRRASRSRSRSSGGTSRRSTPTSTRSATTRASRRSTRSSRSTRRSPASADRRTTSRRRLVITQHAARGSLHADLGDVSFFPWGDPRHANRVVAVAGMGRPGTFDGTGLRRLVGELVVAVTALPPARRVCAVLIGSGEGTLTIPQAVSGWLDGIADAAQEIATSGIYDAPVETDRLRRARPRDGPRRSSARVEDELERRRTEQRPSSVKLTLAPRLKRGTGGTVSIEESVALAAESLVAGGRRRRPDRASGSRSRRSSSTAARTRPCASSCCSASWTKAAASGRSTKRPRFRVERRMALPPSAETPARISFWDDGQTIRAAAIHQAATVPERFVGVGRDVIDDLIVKMTDPPASDVDELCRLLQRLLVPGEFADVLRSGSFVFEVDRSLARLHWEMQPELMRPERRGLAAVGPQAVRAPDEDRLQPRADAARAPGRRAARARDRRPRRSGEGPGPARRHERGAEGQGAARVPRRRLRRGAHRRSGRRAGRRALRREARRPARGPRPAPERRLRPRPLRGPRRLRPRAAEPGRLGLRPRPADAGRDRASRAGAGRDRLERLPLRADVVHARRRAQARRRADRGRPPARASRTSSSSSASATTSARRGRSTTSGPSSSPGVFYTALLDRRALRRVGAQGPRGALAGPRDVRRALGRLPALRRPDEQRGPRSAAADGDGN